MKYRKKPVVIEAYQTDVEIDIETLEGTMKAMPSDWIITGVKGERYPCKDEIFRLTYEAVEQPEDIWMDTPGTLDVPVSRCVE